MVVYHLHAWANRSVQGLCLQMAHPQKLLAVYSRQYLLLRRIFYRKGSLGALGIHCSLQPKGTGKTLSYFQDEL